MPLDMGPRNFLKETILGDPDKRPANNNEKPSENHTIIPSYHCFCTPDSYDLWFMFLHPKKTAQGLYISLDFYSPNITSFKQKNEIQRSTHFIFLLVPSPNRQPRSGVGRCLPQVGRKLSRKSRWKGGGLHLILVPDGRCVVHRTSTRSCQCPVLGELFVQIFEEFLFAGKKHVEHWDVRRFGFKQVWEFRWRCKCKFKKGNCRCQRWKSRKGRTFVKWEAKSFFTSMFGFSGCFFGGVFFSTFVLVTILKTKRIPCWVKFSRCFMLFHLFFHLWTFYPAKFTNISTSRICHPFKNPPKFIICPDLSLRRRLYNFQFLKTKSNSEILTSQKILPWKGAARDAFAAAFSRSYEALLADAFATLPVPERHGIPGFCWWKRLVYKRPMYGMESKKYNGVPYPKGCKDWFQRLNMVPTSPISVGLKEWLEFNHMGRFIANPVVASVDCSNSGASTSLLCPGGLTWNIDRADRANIQS